MALRRDTARNLKSAIDDENAFVEAVALELAAGRIKKKEAEKLIINWYQRRDRIRYQIDWALRDRYLF